MQTNLDPASELFLANVGRIQQRLADANRQVASGKKILQASDAPDEIDSLLQLRADRQQNQQIQSNLALAKTDALAADDALSSSIKLLDRALVLGSQGANSITDSTARQTLAQEVQALQDQMVVNSRTAVQGRYIFSGDQDGSPVYVSDPAAINGVTQLQAVTSTRQIEDASGGTFAASKTAQEIFDLRNPDGTPAAGSVFAALGGLYTALLAGDTATIATAVASVKSASSQLNSMQAFYGTVQNRIQDASDFAGSYDTQLQTELSQKEDADVVSAALELSQANTQLQAAFQMRAALPHKSLFDYM
jgi:flagellar hook-associated protein 3 FlgL